MALRGTQSTWRLVLYTIPPLYHSVKKASAGAFIGCDTIGWEGGGVLRVEGKTKGMVAVGRTADKLRNECAHFNALRMHWPMRSLGHLPQTLERRHMRPPIRNSFNVMCGRPDI
jgi:hypothetical protein